jgi:hypothetical protein
MANKYAAQLQDRIVKNGRGEDIPLPCSMKATNALAAERLFPLYFGTDAPREFLNRTGWSLTEMCTIATKQLDFISEITGQRLVANETLETHLQEAPNELPQSWYCTSFRCMPSANLVPFKSVSTLPDDPALYRTFGRDPRLSDDDMDALAKEATSAKEPLEVCAFCLKTGCARSHAGGGKLLEQQHGQQSYVSAHNSDAKVSAQDQHDICHGRAVLCLQTASPSTDRPPKHSNLN